MLTLKEGDDQQLQWNHTQATAGCTNNAWRASSYQSCLRRCRLLEKKGSTSVTLIPALDDRTLAKFELVSVGGLNVIVKLLSCDEHRFVNSQSSHTAPTEPPAIWNAV